MLWRALFTPKATKPKPKAVLDDIIDGPHYRLRIRHNPRAKRIRLRIDAKTSDVVLTVPRRGLRNEGLAFAHTRHAWIMEHLSKNAPHVCLRPDHSLSLLGKSYRLEQQKGIIAARLFADEQVIRTSGDEAQFARRLLKLIKKIALERAQDRVAYFAARLGVSDVKVSLIDAKSRWGSCTPMRKTIRINWRLVFAETAVFDYVCAHEAAHLRHLDHSKAFWACVEDLFGDYRPARQWLKAQGNDLHLIC
jgi:hypothetical protein